MAVVVWAKIPILLDPIICHARQPSLVSYLPFAIWIKKSAKWQAAMLSQQTCGGNGESPVVRLMAKAKAPDTSTLGQKVIGLNRKHDHSIHASDFCFCFFVGLISRRCCSLSVCKVDI